MMQAYSVDTLIRAVEELTVGLAAGMIGRVQYKRKLHIAYGLQLLQHVNANM